jgi:hypothetical protein
MRIVIHARGMSAEGLKISARAVAAGLRRVGLKQRLYVVGMGEFRNGELYEERPIDTFNHGLEVPDRRVIISIDTEGRCESFYDDDEMRAWVQFAASAVAAKDPNPERCADDMIRKLRDRRPETDERDE